MIRNMVWVCAALAGFGMTLERPNNLAEARRRCCYNQYRHSRHCYQTGYPSYGCQTQYVNPCVQIYGQGTQYQNNAPGGEANVPPPAPAPAPDDRSTYDRNGSGGRDTNDRNNAGAATPNAPQPNPPTPGIPD